MTRSSTLIGEPKPLTAYASNNPHPSGPHHIRGGGTPGGKSDWRHEVTYSFAAYGNSRLAPKPTSDLETWTQTPTRMNQWIISCIVERSLKKINTIITAMSNRNIFLHFFLSVDVMLSEEALVVLTNLSRLVVKTPEEPLSQVHGWVNR